MKTTNAHIPNTRTRTAGFSFIEVLIVMGVIAVLVGMVLVVIPMAMHTKDKALTRTRVQKVAAALQEVKHTFGVPAPATLAALSTLDGARRPARVSVNDTNESIESATRAIHWKGQRLDPGIHEDEYCNTDGDALARLLSKLGEDRLLEIRDEWNNPLVYIPAHAYGPVDSTPIAYITEDGTRVLVRPWKNASGHFEQPGGFQVFSMGPDGKPNTEDDIKHWRS